MGIPPGYLTLPVEELLDALAARTPAPAGGSAAAVALGLAAALAAMAARFADGHFSGAAEAAVRAESLRARARPLADADAAAYGAVLEALRRPERDVAGRRAAVETALRGAAAVPLELAAIAAEVAELGSELAEQGNPNLRGDAASAAVLAEACARIAAMLVAVNLAGVGDGDRIELARRDAAAAREAAARALAASG